MANNPQTPATAPESPVRRSYLFVPGARPDRFAKALGAGADAVIIDLEDAVAPGDKDSARAAVGAFLREHADAGGPAIFVRTNSLRSRTGLLDILALTDLPDGAAPRWAGVLLPKVDGAEDVRLAAGLLDERGLPGALGALIESADGLENVMAIAAASPRLSFLMFGGADLSAELRVPLAWEPLVQARTRIVHAAARFGLDALDMPWIALDDEEGYRQELARSVLHGFTARSAIHPKQIAAIHDAYTPSPEAVLRAGRVLAAFGAAGGGVCVLDGKLVERPLVLGSHRILALARRAGML
ncbi:CoA ester lyase [Azospirillum formosense]|uniref:CoA ester lyase n=1 Tax=Azospirillum formosense TaxID=861533 RepID=A0ABX2L7I9_9PROT|nr:CoA ester lyase [Azospirillum formosense]MBY3756862.1 CoA ester lyase [Azospirillum formosense]NUB22892.1 CoA ester lyase [Azospirillum formosense]